MKEIRQIILLENAALFLLFAGLLLKIFQRKKDESVTFPVAENNRAVFTDTFLFLFLGVLKRSALPLLPMVFLFLFFLTKAILTKVNANISEKICLYSFLSHFYEALKQYDALTSFKNALLCLSDRQKNLIETNGILEEKDRIQMEVKCTDLSKKISDKKMDEVFQLLLSSCENRIPSEDYLSVRKEEANGTLKQLLRKKEKTENNILLLKISTSLLCICILCTSQNGRISG